MAVDEFPVVSIAVTSIGYLSCVIPAPPLNNGAVRSFKEENACRAPGICCGGKSSPESTSSISPVKIKPFVNFFIPRSSSLSTLTLSKPDALTTISLSSIISAISSPPSVEVIFGDTRLTTGGCSSLPSVTFIFALSVL